jgi:hypothetical protein
MRQNCQLFDSVCSTGWHFAAIDDDSTEGIGSSQPLDQRFAQLCLISATFVAHFQNNGIDQLPEPNENNHTKQQTSGA